MPTLERHHRQTSHILEFCVLPVLTPSQAAALLLCPGEVQLGCGRGLQSPGEICWEVAQTGWLL